MDRMPAVRTPRSAWIDQGLRALAAGGPDAVRVEPLARALGVTKGGFYWHFENRSTLLDEMLDVWERVSIDEVIARVETDGGDARERLRRLFHIATTPASRDVLRADLAVRDWARRDAAVARRLRGSTPGGWTTCGRSSARSGETRRRSRRAVCSR